MTEFEVLTVTQVMDLLQLSRDTVYRLAAIGELPGHKVGRTWRFLKDEIEQYVRGELPNSNVAGQCDVDAAPAEQHEASLVAS